MEIKVQKKCFMLNVKSCCKHTVENPAEGEILGEI